MVHGTATAARSSACAEQRTHAVEPQLPTIALRRSVRSGGAPEMERDGASCSPTDATSASTPITLPLRCRPTWAQSDRSCTGEREGRRAPRRREYVPESAALPLGNRSGRRHSGDRLPYRSRAGPGLGARTCGSRLSSSQLPRPPRSATRDRQRYTQPKGTQFPILTNHAA